MAAVRKCGMDATDDSRVKFGFNSQDVIKEALRLSPKVLLSFSCGKDSIGAYLAIRDAGFEDIVCFYMMQVPGNLSFIEESLDYYERTLFGGRRIIRVPHPFIARAMQRAVLQPPERLDLIKEMDFESFTAQDLSASIADWLGWPETTLTAVGVRATDSQNRYSMFKKRGMGVAVNQSNGKFYPVFDWNKDKLLTEINKAGVKLPVDYRLFGKTFDGLDLRFIAPLKKHFPADYEKLRFWWPMIDVELFRYEHRQEA